MTDQQPKRIHRRIMAYVALIALISIGIQVFREDIGPANAEVLITICYVLGAIVLAYLGAQIAPEVFKKQ